MSYHSIRAKTYKEVRRNQIWGESVLQ